MIIKVAQISDVHIRKSIERHDEYKKIFNQLYSILQSKKPDRIVIVGDLYNDYIDLSGEAQILMASFLNNLSRIAPIVITRGNHDCFTYEHEILTKNGWYSLEYYIENNMSEEVLTFNSDKNIFEFQKPLDTVKKEFNGLLKNIETNKGDFTVTPTHEILLKQGSRNTFIKKYAKDLTLNNELRIPLSSNEIIENNDKWFELLGFCLADATFVIKNKKNMNGRVQFHFKKERKIEYLHNLLNDLNIPHNIRVGDKERNTKVICIYSEPARNIMKFFNYTKELTYNNILSNDKYKLKSFIDGYLNGDGCNLENERYSCTTIFKNNAEILTTISNYIGYYGYIQDKVKKGNYKNSKLQYTLFINKNNINKSSEITNIKDVSYNGYVYCLTVKNENLFIRNKNNTFITGNCRKKNLERVDTIETITKLINNPTITYYNQSGFYEDDNVTWVVWHHRDQNIKNTWADIKHTKKKDQIYIDLYHNPVTGCLSHNGLPMKNGEYINIDSFKGDIVALGDIHLYQTFRKDKTAAYSSSLIQQNFGELPYGHGFIMWDLKNKTHEFIEIPNEHTYINFELKENTDYENLLLESPYIKSKPEIKVKWTDLSSNVNKSNEIKIRQYIKEKYNLDKIRIEKNPIYTDITDVKFVNEGLDINNKEIQRSIFEEFLKLNKYDDKFIKDVLSLDDIINMNLDLGDSHTSIDWKIEKFWFDNFKSYDDGQIIDWDGINGIIQIHGENQQGKTTILDAITYICYGKTLSTKKTEKFGDSRFLNNKRDLDECSGGAVLNINGEQYTIFRKTIRKWNKTKTELSSVKTELDYYKGCEIKEENKLTDETLKRTQPIIDNALGTFDDFIRLTLTNADNLNDLLSIDRAVFIDSLIRDAGFDIFETKLRVFKDYIKQLNEEKIVLNVLDENEKVTSFETEIVILKNKIESISNQIIIKKDELNIIRIKKEDEIKKLHKIDDSISNENIDTLLTDNKNNNNKILSNNEEISTLKNSNINLPTEFNYNDYKIKKDKLSNDASTLSTLKVDVTKLSGEIQNLETEISQTDEKIKNIIDNKITLYKNNIETKNNNIENKKKDIIQLLKDHLNILKDEAQVNKNQIEILKNKQESIKDKATEYKNEIAEIEESKICIQCGRPLEAEHMEHVRERVATIKSKINKLQEEFEAINIEKQPYQKKINSIVERSEKIKNKNFENEPELKIKYDEAMTYIRTIQSDITIIEDNIKLLEDNKLDSFSDIQDEIKNIKDNKEKYLKIIEDKKTLKSKNTNEYNTLLDIYNELKKDIDKLEIIKTNYETLKDNLNSIDKLTLENDNLSLKIKNTDLLVEKIQSQSIFIEANKVTQQNIDNIQMEIDNLENEIEKLSTEKEENNNTIILKQNELNLINNNIKKFEEQSKRDEIRKVYQQSIHRDGLPTYLLKKSIHIINQELSNLLTNVDFTAYFDDELNLKLSADNRLDVCQNAIESSGKERTFISIALKLALRKVNKKSKCDFMLFDEVMGKLLAKSVDEFIEFLDVVVSQIGKVIIIEHVHPINYDAMIEVKKDEKGISNLELIL